MSSLQLTIPAQVGDGSGIRIKPREVREWLDNLPCLDIQRAATLVNEQLRLMNRQVIVPTARLEMLGEFLGTYLRLLESAPVAATGEALRLQAALKRLSQNIGFGYKIALHELVNKKAGLLEARHLPAALLGSIHAVGLQLTHYYAAYQRAPHALWNECLAIYRYARKSGREAWQGKLPGVGTVSIGDAFRLLALLRLADPYALPAGALRGLQCYWRARGALAVIDDENPDATLALPLLRSGRGADSDTATPLYLLLPATLTEQINTDIERLEKYQSIRALELPDDVAAPMLANALRQVLAHWKSGLARTTQREETLTRIELASGLDAAYGAVNKGRPFDPGLFYTPGQDEVIDIGARPAPEPAAARTLELLQCNSLDRSQGGLRVSCRADTRPKPQAGQLFAVRRAASSGGAWVIAVCRWLAEAESSATLEIGLQYLAREPEAVVIRPLQSALAGGDYQPAIAAAQKRAEQHVLTLIARAGQLSGGAEFVLYTRHGQQQARCIELLESGHGFERFIYELDA